MIDLAAAVRFHARRTPAAPALRYDGRTTTYADLATRVAIVAGWLAARGVAPGDRVAALMRNSPAFLELALATSQVGAILVPINFRLAADEVAYILADAGVALLVMDDDLAAGIGQAAPTITVDAHARTALATLSQDGAPAPPHSSAPEDAFRIMYTSGTTDRPKGVVHSYTNYHWKCVDHAAVLGLSNATRLLVVGPLYHVGAFDLPGVGVLARGGCLVLMRDFDPDAVLETMAREAVTGAWLAPVMLAGVLERGGAFKGELETVEWVVGGGERTPENRIHAFGDIFSHARYIDAYGLTETLSGDTFMEAGREIEKIGSTGRPIPHVDLTILDDDGVALAAGGEGEICLRGPKVFRGYWNAPEKTAASFTDNWFRTGDVGYLDEDGFLFITDRKKDMILSGGENVASSEVERVVQAMPGVVEAAVIGLPDARWGEVPVAVIVAGPDGVDADGLLAHCRRNLAGFKAPKRIVLTDVLPRNPSGKVLKRELRAAMAARIDEEVKA